MYEHAIVLTLKKMSIFRIDGEILFMFFSIKTQVSMNLVQILKSIVDDKYMDATYDYDFQILLIEILSHQTCVINNSSRFLGIFKKVCFKAGFNSVNSVTFNHMHRQMIPCIKARITKGALAIVEFDLRDDQIWYQTRRGGQDSLRSVSHLKSSSMILNAILCLTGSQCSCFSMGVT